MKKNIFIATVQVALEAESQDAASNEISYMFNSIKLEKFIALEDWQYKYQGDGELNPIGIGLIDEDVLKSEGRVFNLGYEPPAAGGFIVLQVLVGGSFQPVFMEDEKLMFSDTAEAADKAIQECIADVAEAVKKGDMSDEYTTDDYRVVAATKTGTTIRCSVDGDNFIMDETDDDYVKI